MINWTAFDWQSFATLVTGVLAVGAASFVGIRQVGLLRGQNKIAEQALRLDLLDRRVRILSAMQTARIRMSDTVMWMDDSFRTQLVNDLQEGELLFPSHMLKQFADLIYRVEDCSGEVDDRFDLALDIAELHAELVELSRVQLTEA